MNFDEQFEKAITACSQFLPGNWTKAAAAIETSVLQGGYSDIIILCQLKPEFCDASSQPHKVVVRFLTGRNIFGRLSESLQTVAFHAVAEAKLGPKLLGAFNGGRIEEFIDGHMLTYDEIRDQNVLKAAGEALAKLHSLDIPMQKSPPYLEFFTAQLKNVEMMVRHSDVVKNIDKTRPDVAETLRKVLDIDFLGEFKLIVDNLHRIKTRNVCLAHWDHHMHNVMIRNNAKKGAITESDLVTLDIEMGSWSPRGVDFGYFINEPRYDYSGANHFSPKFVGELSPQLERVFLESYLNKWRQLNPQKYDPALDNIDALLAEKRVLQTLIGPFAIGFILAGFVQNPTQFPGTMFDFLLHRREIDVRQFNEAKKILKLN